MGSCIQLQQRNCSGFTPDFLRRSTFPSSQRTKVHGLKARTTTGLTTSGLRLAAQDLFIKQLVSWQLSSAAGLWICA
jgi:hypothetical protein